MPHPLIGERLLQSPSSDRGPLREPRPMGGASGGTMAPRDVAAGEADWRDLHLAMLEQAARAPWAQAPALRAELEEELHRVILDLLNETTRIARLLDGD